LPEQRVSVDGQEMKLHFITKDGSKAQIRNLKGGDSFFVDASKIQPLDDVVSPLQNPRLARLFRDFRQERGLSWERGFNAFVDDIGLDPKMRPAFREYLVGQEAGLLSRTINPAENRLLKAYEEARRKILMSGETIDDLDGLAASRGFAVNRLRDGRVKLTDTGGHTTPYKNEEVARAFLRDAYPDAPNLAPEMGDIPEEIVAGTMNSTSPPNPAIGMQADIVEAESKRVLGKRGAFVKFWRETFGRAFTGMESLGQQWETATNIPIWSQGMQPVSKGATTAMNRSTAYFNRVHKAFKGLSPKDQNLLDRWLRSDLKTVFEQAEGMSPKLVQRGKTIRRIMDDLFEELSESSGTKLSFDDYYQNYSPDVLAWIDETKGLDFEKLWFNDGRALPNEIRFFGEMHKTGELAQR
jgi:hypothetical protein